MVEVCPEGSKAARHPEGQQLLASIKRNIDQLTALLTKIDSHWGAEDGFYRFYHGSFKVYGLQRHTCKIVDLFREIEREAGGCLNQQFLNIVEEGTGIVFEPEHNLEWGRRTRPIVEAFLHAREMLRMTVKYGRSLSEAPTILPSGWATVLYLYGMR